MSDQKTTWAASAVIGLCLPLTVHAQGTELQEIFQSRLACELIEPLLSDSPVATVFSATAEGCVPVTPEDDGATLQADNVFVDASCRVSIPFEPTRLPDWCSSVFDASELGEGAGLSTDPALARWTLSPGSRFDVGTRPLSGSPQPWVQRMVYREIDTDQGLCRLEMRVFAPRPVINGASTVVDDGVPESNGRALIAWHGGSWSNRGFGTVGLELTIPHFTERGFTVFAPFYRLLGDSEGSPACHNADFESGVVADAIAAFDWVANNADRYGVSGTPVLFGQSAGAHLAARLAVEFPDEVASAVLFYPPVDFDDFVSRAQAGSYTNPQGIDIVSRVANLPLSDVDRAESPIPENSLPQRALQARIALPPLFMLHGDADGLVESRQSVRLCEALNGNRLTASDVEVPAIEALRRVFLCGERSVLHRVREAQHALDLCFFSALVPTDLCLAGSEASRQLVADSIASSAVFAADTVAEASNELFIDDVPLADGSTADESGEGGGGAALWLLGLSLVYVSRRRLQARMPV